MRITCDTSCSMGYIYLFENSRYRFTNSQSIRTQFDDDALKIKMEYVLDIKNRFINKIQELTYSEAEEKGDISEEYQNDKNMDGYIIGIELNLRKEALFQLIETEAFKFFDTFWDEEECFVITFVNDMLLSDENIRVYPINKNEDTFVICSPKTEIECTKIYGIISKRFDIYNVEYLKQLDFVISGC